MKIKDLIKHLETLDQEKELIVISTDPTGWEYGEVVNDITIGLESVYPCEENGLEGQLIMTEDEEDEGDVECYVINVSC
jgi:hypothetical protein